MNTIEQLDELQKKAIHTPELKKRFLASKKAEDPLGEFCLICQQEAMIFILWISFKPEMNFTPQ